jgi:release factor glutamine methyltransferase
MMVKTAFEDFTERLKAIYSIGEAAFIAKWVFEVVAGVQQPASAGAIEMTEATAVVLEQKLIELLAHKPVQYVLGEAWFYNIKFKVNEHVLIPRPETEELVEWCIKEIANGAAGVAKEGTNPAKDNAIHSSPLVIRNLLDIGTGSGCIAVALKKELPAFTVTGIDISDGALLVARKNADSLGVEVNFIQLDFLDEDDWARLPQFDVIVSNPPYIPLNEKSKLDNNVTDYEPHTALFVPDNAPLLFYEKIARFGLTHLGLGGFVMVEIHQDFAQEATALFSKYYTSVACKKDISGNERMIMATR